MSEKQQLIKEMLQMQRQFIQLERAGRVTPKSYFAPTAEDPLYNYRKDFTEKAMTLVDMAHAERGSKR